MDKRFWLLISLCLLLLVFTGCDMVDNPEGPTSTPVPTMPPETDAVDEPEDPEDTEPEDGDAWISSEDGAEGNDTGGDDALGGVMLANAAGDPLPTELGAIIPEEDDTGDEEPIPAEDETPPVETTPGPVSLVITPEPGETPMLLDPIDKPTPAPVVSVYRPYTNGAQRISFDVPLLWSFYSSADTNMAFYEPEEDATEGYQASLTVQTYSFGSEQNAEDAKNRLIEIMAELSLQPWDSFAYNNDSESTTMAKAKGYYAYYNAEYNKVKVKGRVMVVAHGAYLYQVRISCPASKYSAYEEVFREVRRTWAFLQ